MWGGSILSLPQGYALCDGTAGTPDLRNRFIVGSGSTYSTGSTGGAADAVVVAHTHTVTDPGHTHPVEGSTPNNFQDDRNGSEQTRLGTTTTTSSATTGITINTTGESGIGKNLPPYYALAFIQRVS